MVAGVSTQVFESKMTRKCYKVQKDAKRITKEKTSIIDCEH